jgi:O-antigen ligase
MASQAQTAVFAKPLIDGRSLPLGEKVFLTLICMLTAIPNLKLGLIEPLELYFLFYLGVLLISFAAGGFALRISKVWWFYGVPHLIFMVVAFALAILALRQPYFLIPEEKSILKQPFFISIARLIEYFLVAFYMLYIADLLRKRKAALIFALRAYVCVGILTSFYGLISFVLDIAFGIKYLGSYGGEHRVAGSFDEGGPFGLYLVSVLMSLLLLSRMRKVKTGWILLLSGILITTIALSQSKAAFSALAIMILATVLFGRSFRVRVGLLIGLGVLVAGVIAVPNIYLGLMSYLLAATDKTTGLLDDSSFGFGGRAAALILVPRMIAAHPFAGIGLGNYQLVRNDPHYLQGLPPLMHWDYSGVGLIVKIAELGVPLTLFLSGVLLLPLRTAVRKKTDLFLKIFACYQLIATLQGVELHFFYPWLCSGFVLAALYFERPMESTQKLAVNFSPKSTIAVTKTA